MRRAGAWLVAVVALLGIACWLWPAAPTEEPPASGAGTEPRAAENAASAAQGKPKRLRADAAEAAKDAASSANAEPDAYAGLPRSTLRGTLHDADGAALAFPLSAERMDPWRLMPPLTKTTVPRGGEFEFAGLPAGDYLLRATVGGGVDLPVGRVRVPGMPRLDIVLPVGSHIRGTVVEDATDEPLAGATVRAGDVGAWIGAATADEQGRFDIHCRASLAGAKRYLVQRGDRFAIIRANDGDEGSRWISTEWDGVGRDVVLRVPGGCVLRGGVTGPDGPVANALVTVRGTDEERDVLATMRTNEAGRYEFSGLPLGSYAVTAEAAGLEEDTGAPFPGTKKFAWVFVGSAEPSDHDVTMVAAGAARRCPVAMRAVDEGGAPVAGAAISGDIRPGAPVAVSASDGTFEMSVPVYARGTIVLVARREGFLVTGALLDDTPSGLTGDFVMHRPRRVHGTVTLPDGSAVAGASVAVLPARPESAWEWNGGVPETTAVAGSRTQTGADGTYTAFAPIADGRCTVIATVPGRPAVRSEPCDVEPPSTDAEIDIVIDERTLTGHVVLRGTTQPAQGAIVRVGSANENETVAAAVTGADGAFGVEHLPAVTLSVTAGGPAWLGHRFEAEPGTDDVTIEVIRLSSIEGRVDIEGEGPAAGATIATLVDAYPWASDNEHFVEITAGPDGRFAIRSVPAGEYQLRVSAGRVVDQRVQVAAGARDVCVVMKRGVRVAGHVLDEAGAPVAGARVEGWTANAPPGSEANAVLETDAAGAFEFTTLPSPGPFRVAASSVECVGSVIDGVVAGESSLKLTLGPGLAVEGTVLKPDGTPAAMLWFEVDRAPGEFQAEGAHTDAEGRFEMSSRAPGPHVFRSFDLGEGRGANYQFPETVVIEAGKKLVVRCVARK